MKEYKDYRFTCNYRHLNKEDKLIINQFVKELRVILDKKGIKFRRSITDKKFLIFKESQSVNAFIPMINIKDKNGWNDIPACVQGKEVILFRK